jgi:hypothetical protein
MFSDKVKYNTPLPGIEFKTRDLSIPAEAARVVYEIDFQYGQDRELCLSILTNVFRGTPQITQILQEAGRLAVQGGGPTGAPWHHEAIVQRNLRTSLLERKMASATKAIEASESDMLLFRSQERQARHALEQEVRGQAPGVGSGSQGRGGLSGQAPGQEGGSGVSRGLGRVQEEEEGERGVARGLEGELDGAQPTPAPASTSTLPRTPSTPFTTFNPFTPMSPPVRASALPSVPALFGSAAGWLGRLQEDMRAARIQLSQAEEDFGAYAEELAILRADPKNERFSAAEEAEAKAKLQRRGGAAPGGQGDGGVAWKECLQKVLGALLQTTTVTLSRKRMAQIGRQAVEFCVREGRPLLEFASDLDKALLFAGWQAKVFSQDANALPEALATLEQRAFDTFQENLKAVEMAQFFYISAEEPEPFQKVIARLRSLASVVATVPALPVRASAAKKGGGGKVLPRETGEEEEEEEAPKKRKVPVKSVAIAEVSEEEGPAPLTVAAITGALDQWASKNLPQAQGQVPGPQGERPFISSTPQASQGFREGGGGGFGRHRGGSQGEWGSGSQGGGRGGYSGQERGWGSGSRGGRGGSQGGGFRNGRGGFAGRGSSGGGDNGFSGQCRFSPCVSPVCTRNHRPGQHKPDGAAFLRRATFTAQNRCVGFHDGACERGVGDCSRAHGVGNGQAKERCPKVGTGMCEEFFSSGGCRKAHRA